MRYLLDTSIIIDLLRNEETVRKFIADHMEDEIITSCICQAEVAAGIYHSKTDDISKRKKQTDEIFSSFFLVSEFDSSQADIFGRIKADLAENGQLIEDMDILIAAACISNNAILVTGNLKHFDRVKNLQIFPL